jgi:hypothetical protein
MIHDKDFPRLTKDNHRVTSPPTIEYNCVAWAAADTAHWWQPGKYWLPPDWPADDFGIGALEHAFLALDYKDCAMDATLETGFEKVALYGTGGFTPTPPGSCPAASGRANSGRLMTLNTKRRKTLPAEFTEMSWKS